MKIRKFGDSYLLRLEKHEELIEMLIRFVREEDIQGAVLHGLGGALSATLGIYMVDGDREYHFKDFEGPLEIVSLNGNVARDGDDVLIHAHATISGTDLVVYGGHLKRATIGGTCEIVLDTSVGPLGRSHSDDIGLKLLDLDEYELAQDSSE